MSYTNLRDFAPEFETERELLSLGRVKLQLEKLGGGTLGQAYEGNWRYRVLSLPSDRTLAQGQDLVTGTPATHYAAADQLAAFLRDNPPDPRLDYDTAQAFENAADASDTEIMTDYSGRDMFGRECVAVTGSDARIRLFLVELAIELSYDADSDQPAELVRELARTMRTDNLGYNTVAYWPSILWPLDEV